MCESVNDKKCACEHDRFGRPANHFHKLFGEIHADYKSQFENSELTIADDEAVAACRKKLSGDPDNYDYITELGGALCYQLRYREAYPVYEKAITVNPDRVFAHRRLALCALKLLRFDKAIEEFTLCGEHSGMNLDLLYRIGLCRFYSGNFSAAENFFNKCYGLCEGDGDMYIAVIYWHILSLARQGKDLSPALEKYRDDIKIGHHMGYLLTAQLFSGHKNTDALVADTRGADEMTYTILLYGAYHYALLNGDGDKAKQYLTEMLSYKTYWASFCWIAAYVDGKKLHLL